MWKWLQWRNRVVWSTVRLYRTEQLAQATKLKELEERIRVNELVVKVLVLDGRVKE